MSASLQRSLSTLMLITTLAFSVVMPAHAESFGLSSGNATITLAADTKVASRFTLTEPGVLSTFRIVLDGNGGPQTGFQYVALDLYQDANGVPGVKLVESAPQKINALAARTQTEFYVNAVPLPAGNYWIAAHAAGASNGSTSGIVRVEALDTGTKYSNADTFSDGASSPFGAGTPASTGLAASGVYMPQRLAKFAGRETVASTPSGGLTSNFKRGSRFTLSETGRVLELSAYLDGKGAGSGSQKVRLALYRDAAGVPGTLVIQSNEITVKAGQAASWLSAHVQPTDLAAGNYWIVIHSGDTSGIARDYGDGAANWYANADTYADGAATSFGAGSTGTVTISAGAVYVPGPVHTGTLGRTSIAVTPSGGLSTNLMRGSTFGDIPDAMGVMTAIWVYLDGNGGGSGSQQVRGAMYGDASNPHLAALKEVETEVVTIPAGLSPRWVRLPLKAPVGIYNSNWPEYDLMLQSGDTAGVARDYGDGPADWISRPDAFADGSDGTFTASQAGTVTLSIYLEYEVPASTP